MSDPNPRNWGTGMKGWLVVLGTTLDDLPIKLFAHDQSTAAREFAESIVDPDNDEWVNKVYDMLGRDRAEPINVAVVEFLNGGPVDYTIVRDFTSAALDDAGMSNDA